MRLRRWFYIGFAALLILTFLLPAVSCSPSGPSVYKVVYGAGTTTSGNFVHGIAYCDVINKYAEGVKVDQISIPATEPKIILMGKGDMNFGGQMSYESFAWAYNGLLLFKDKPMKNLRIFHVSAISAHYWVVREDSGVNKVEDLNGKSFAPGATGTSAFEMHTGMLAAWGIKPVVFNGSWNDITTAMKDKRVVGFGKTQSGMQVDSTVLDVQSFTPVKIIGFTKDQLEIGLKDLPAIQRIHVAPGVIKALPNAGEFWTNGIAQVVGATTDLPQEIGYKMIKASVEHWDEITAVYTQGKMVTDPIQFTIDQVMLSGMPVPLHAGVVQYFEERGAKLPPELIGPEYKKK